MKVKFSTSELKDRLSQISAVVAKKAPVPVYGFLRLVAARPDPTALFSVWLTGIDIDATLTVRLIKAEVDEEVDVLIPFAKLSELVSNHTVAELILDVPDETKAVLKGGRASAVLQTHPLTNWPTVMERPETAVATLNLGGFKKQIGDVGFCIPTADGKFTSAVALFESTDKTSKLVATDGFRMGLSELPGNAGTFKLIMPKTALEYISKLTGETVTLYESEAGFYAQTEMETLTASRSHGAFPNYNDVIPKTITTTITTDTPQLLQAVKRTRPLADAETPGVTFSVEKDGTAMLLVAGSQEAEQTFRSTATDEVDATVTGQANLFSLDVAKLQPFLEKVTGKLVINILDAQHVVDFVALEGQYRFLQMPMRIVAAAK